MGRAAVEASRRTRTPGTDSTAAQFLERSQSAEGNIDLLATNFNSPPDTGFVVHNVATAAAIAKLYGAEEILRALRPFLVKAAGGMSVGGIHTPNHRWVVSSALAQVNHLFPDPAYTRRIAQWLAEGIDIDEDGQFIERSTITYNTVTDRAFTVLAAKLQASRTARPGAPQSARHVVSAASRRRSGDRSLQAPGPVRARHDGRILVPGELSGGSRWRPASLPDWLAAWRRRVRGSPRCWNTRNSPARCRAAGPLPEDYEKWFGAVGLARIRRGRWDATLVLKDSSRFFSARNGGAVINAVRFASSFFGKGQFVPDTCVKEGSNYVFRQSLSAPYYQPLTPPQRVDYRNWGALRSQRRQTQVCKLEQWRR